MTPVVKLVFGADYDKTRLAEFAAALSWARREALPQGSFAATLEAQEGGLKAVVRAERRARRPVAEADPVEEARARLREADGRLAVLAPVPDPALTDRAIRKAAA